MKLITEHIDQELEVICEAKKNGREKLFYRRRLYAS